MSNSTTSSVRSPALQLSIDRFKRERANAANKGLVLLPSVEGPYAFDPVHDRVVGRSGSEEYRMTVSDQPLSMTRERFLELQTTGELLDLNHAQGRVLPGHCERAQQIEELMNASPWTLHPDYGCILKSEELDAQGKLVQRSLLKSMESDERYVVVRLCIGTQLQYLGRVSSLKAFEEYRDCCGFDKSDIAIQDWKPQSQEQHAPVQQDTQHIERADAADQPVDPDEQHQLEQPQG